MKYKVIASHVMETVNLSILNTATFKMQSRTFSRIYLSFCFRVKIFFVKEKLQERFKD